VPKVSVNPSLKIALTSFQDALGVKIWLDLLKGLWSYGGFKLRGSGFPTNFQRPLAAKLSVRPVMLKYAGTMAPTAPMAPILLVVGGAKVELAQALVPCETGAM